MPLDPAFRLDSYTGDYLAYAFKLATETDYPEDLQRLEISPMEDVSLVFSDGCNQTTVMLTPYEDYSIMRTVAVFFDETYSWDVRKIGEIEYDDDAGLFIWYSDGFSGSHVLRGTETLEDAIARGLLEAQ